MEYMEKLLNEENDWDGVIEANINVAKVEYIKKGEVEWALRKIKTGKAVGNCKVATEMLKATGDWGIERLADLLNIVIRKKEISKDIAIRIKDIPEDWEKSIILPISKGDLNKSKEFVCKRCRLNDATKQKGDTRHLGNLENLGFEKVESM
ncbi:hypothetical protein HELRODRAFT_158567 [Helobdella robusta]|uniref:Uncharacterized protein n=1 Tax=Helobdella robusta TaxID=6412 RepID=T1EMY4_HELRO|nr:hypothetical protein HELRODRAFT_158567 [Helobdella robusta]ESO12127.1 hypothetical protein HELRODRAFT_158567 [Helobdella robusta]